MKALFEIQTNVMGNLGWVILLLVVFGGVFFYAWKKRHQKKIISIVFRYDDYSSLSHTETELKVIDLCYRQKIPMTFAVVPFIIEGDVHDVSHRRTIHLSEEKAEFLRKGLQAGVLDIALHGYSHQTNNTERFSEFAGLDFDTQLERLKIGQQFLKDTLNIAIDVFVPPWNAYDLNTLKALEHLRFSTLSADRFGSVLNTSKLKFLPCTCSLERLKNSALQSARNSSDPAPIIVVLFHDFEFKDVDEKRGMMTFQEFFELLAWLKAQEDVRIISIGQAVKLVKDLSVRRFVNADRYSAMYREKMA